jgi:hypothetical protein
MVVWPCQAGDSATWWFLSTVATSAIGAGGQPVGGYRRWLRGDVACQGQRQAHHQLFSEVCGRQLEWW